MKKALRELKSKELIEIKEIKYISMLLQRKNNKIIDGFNHNIKVNNNLCNYFKVNKEVYRT